MNADDVQALRRVAIIVIVCVLIGYSVYLGCSAAH